MPSIQVLPQDKPFDDRQIINMNKSLSNLFQTVETQRIKNEERNIANIISSVEPVSATGVAKTPLQINQEIKSKINLSRQQKGKPGLFDMFNANALPSSITPTEQALNRQGLASLFGAQQSQQEAQQRQQKSRLVEAQIGATEALGAQRRADSAGGFNTLTPSTQTSIINSLTDITNKSLSNIIGKPVSITDRTKKGTGAEAIATLDSQPFDVYQDVYDHVKGLNISKEDQDGILQSYRKRLLAQNADEVEQFHDMLERGIDINVIKQDNLDATNKLAETVSGLGKTAIRSKLLPRGSEIKEIKKDQGKMDELKLTLARDMNKFDADNLLAVKENILDNTDLSDADIDFILEDILGKPLSFEDEEAERDIANKSSNPQSFETELDAILAESLRTSENDEEYKNDYKDIIKALKISESVDTTLNQIKAQL
jgi:hypothetical protein